MGFDDLLNVTLALNHPHLESLIVVTTHEDRATQLVARKHGAICVQTDLFRKNGRKLNKGTNPGPVALQCLGDGTAPGVGDLLYAGWVDGAALGASSGTGVIAFSETLAMASGQTYRLTANQTSGLQLDITGGEMVIERLA